MMTERNASDIEVRREACECGSSDGKVVFQDDMNGRSRYTSMILFY